MSLQQTTEVYYDPYDLAVNADPHPMFRRMRQEAPLYDNEQHDFYAVSRYADVERGLTDRDYFSNARSDVLEFIKAGVEFPSGIFIFEDPPLHTIHRGLVSAIFTPRRMAALESQIREFCVNVLDPRVGSEGFDFVHDLGAQMPMRVIGMMVGIPEDFQESIRDRMNASIATGTGQPITDVSAVMSGELFADFLDFRMTHPGTDIMTDLIDVEFEDETGTKRRLTRDEILNYVNIIAGAGNETTAKLIGWTGKILADHPDQRRQLVENRGLIPDAIEEILRYEPPGPAVARFVTQDAVFGDHTVPAGSALLCLVASANRDEVRFADPDRFDVHRKPRGHLTFSVGAHFCLGAALARLQGRVALEEVLNRFPEWTVDETGAKLAVTSTTRGWERLPVLV